ncbi:MAG: metal ABC transporter permease, partial [Candidatus Hydrogenedentes bacterium]|nr:metal ABC transporter permease [Candidatus Hydrogenedentota bacterium]
MPAGLPPWLEFFTFGSANVVYVLVGSIALSVAAALIGSFAYLRRQSLIGDALAHAALPGVCMAFLLTGTKNPLIILAGATVSCWLGALSVEFIVRYTRCKEDSALGIVLSVFFGVGILLLTWIQKSGAAAQAGLDKFLFGQAAAMVEQDVIVITTVGCLICLVVLLGYKELKLIAFDGDFAAAIGMPRRSIEIVLATLIVLAVAIGLQAVGVVLMAALLVTPAAAARYWTNRLWLMLCIAAAIGAAGGFLGAYISYLSPQMPTGPWMVIAVTSLFLVSFLCAPARGVISRLRRIYRNRRRTARENVLRTFYNLGEHRGRQDSWTTTADILLHRNMGEQRLRWTLGHLRRKGLVEEDADGRYRLTPVGQFRAARLTRLHRLWELYLTRKLELAPDHVHDDAEEVEHIITPEMEERLSAILDHPDRDPHERQIPAREF